MPHYIVIMTASINPNGMPFVLRTDPAVREQDYLDSMQSLLEMRDADLVGVVFVENSGADLASFRRLIETRNLYHRVVDLISLNNNDFPRFLGKGYGEFSMLDGAVKRTALIGRDHLIAKLTGRLRVGNLRDIVRAAPADVDLLADIYPQRKVAAGKVDTRLLIFSPRFYLGRVLGCFQAMNDSNGATAEHLLYQLVRRSQNYHVIPRFTYAPNWIGYSGATGEAYQRRSFWLLKHAFNLKRWIRRCLNQPNMGTLFADPNEDECA